MRSNFPNFCSLCTSYVIVLLLHPMWHINMDEHTSQCVLVLHARPAHDPMCHRKTEFHNIHPTRCALSAAPPSLPPPLDTPPCHPPCALRATILSTYAASGPK